jgi:hypothetical protein
MINYIRVYTRKITENPKPLIKPLWKRYGLYLRIAKKALQIKNPLFTIFSVVKLRLQHELWFRNCCELFGNRGC